jgi:hypothetical protein
MPAATAREVPRFVRRTTLGANEYHTNFRKVDCETISRLTSDEATRVTSQMCKVYLSLLNAPTECWEREGVLRFAGEEKDGGWITAWEQLVSLTGVASATARKALRWMHEQGIIGYFAGKNGVGIRVFINRATSSIGTRAAGKKILEFTRASSRESRASTDEAGFNDSFADLEVLETDLNPRAPENGAETEQLVKTSPVPTQPPTLVTRTSPDRGEREQSSTRPIAGAVFVEEIVERLRSELEPRLRETAARAATQSASREMERTREWFETKALPKAVRVAQRETYDLMRRRGADGGKGSAGLKVGCGPGACAQTEARPLILEEIREAAEVCVALLEVQGRPVETTLSQLSSEAGGWLLPEDVPRVRDLVTALTSGGEPPS